MDGLKALAATGGSSSSGGTSGSASGVTSSGGSAGEGGNDGIDQELMTSLTTALRSFEEAMCDDMNTPR